MKITAVCSNGLGTSLLISINIRSILQELNISAEVSNTDIASLNSTNADLYVMGLDISNSCNVKNKIVLNNLIDKSELKEKLLSWSKTHV